MGASRRTVARARVPSRKQSAVGDWRAAMVKRSYTPTVPSGPPKESTGEEIDLDGELAPGDRAGEYLILGTIASGGCGTVYTAEHRVLGRKAAVKVLHSQLASSPEMVERFVREARVVNRIGHPNIVDIYEFGELGDKRPYFVMELLEGTSLATIVERRGRLTAAQALSYLEPVCDALRAAHSAGVVHRDLKASNVAVVKEGDPPRVKLLDFGIAKLVRTAPGERGLTAVGQRIGTPYAMAPEQIRGGAIDTRVDIYALGVLLYQLLTGRYPFISGDPVEMERLHVESPPPRPSAMAPVSADGQRAAGREGASARCRGRARREEGCFEPRAQDPGAAARAGGGSAAEAGGPGACGPGADARRRGDRRSAGGHRVVGARRRR